MREVVIAIVNAVICAAYGTLVVVARADAEAMFVPFVSYVIALALYHAYWSVRWPAR